MRYWFETIVFSLLAAGVILGEVLASKAAAPAAGCPGDALRELTVHVLAFQGEDSAGSGSGVLFKGSNGSNYVFTAAHCVPEEGGPRMVIEIHPLDVMTPLNQLSSEIVWVDRRRDFALLWVPSPAIFSHYARMATQRPGVGQWVQHVGFMGGHDLPHAYSKGEVFQLNALTCKWLPIPTDAVNIIAMPGSSGGGIFDSKDRFVGILVGASPYGLAFYVPFKDIKDSLIESHLGLVF